MTLPASPAAAPLIVFDLDGTLVDTAPDLISALNHILVREGMAPVPLESARKMIGQGARRLIERGLEIDGREMTPAQIKALTDDFIGYYADHIAEQSLPFDGLVAVLDQMEARGYRFAVCTNKLEWLSRRLLEALGLTHRFAAICGADTFGVSKPDPVILQQTVARAGGAMASVIMVGDAGPDVGVARRAGVPVVGVTFGYTEVPIADLKPDLVVDHFRDLPDAVERLLAKRTA